ncbi:methylthioribose-1-phosphate isomerase [Methanobrevibacter cuticularis]|uniref:Putative methylthioribose-1-phosphate isomerase n=1 Tax=Methanobrevibacter cuticularis TaxID=47311 RepID=A0A166E6G6_9EURY|nr:S-methyl-5-thioribose-1-phosphate isomerase [Methanobrevibacter cuticularis]KZX16330.1 methylthioribose-1-phosphate isomerase [Methanobrevibacter cuticularis]
MKTMEWKDNKLILVDQRKLPDKLSYFVCDNYNDVIVAIKTMVVRGAPAIGVAAAFGVALAQLDGENMRKVAEEIKASRPTAVNLFWAVDRVLASDNPVDEAIAMYHEDIDTNLAIGRNGAEIISDGDTILTHCNAGALACVDYGTALGVVRSAFHQDKKINVICDETRPVGQGARLSVWELQQENIPVKLIPDVAAGYLMQQGKINKVVIGADRVAKDGIVNKIGSLMVALSANRFHVPFYVAAPLSTFDHEISIYDTEIEERNPEEVLYYGGCRIAPKGTEVINPAFDIVPSDLITGIITEKGIIDPNKFQDFFQKLKYK